MRGIVFLFLMAALQVTMAQFAPNTRGGGGSGDVMRAEDNPLLLHKYINPRIGTGGHGHTFPGPTRPFGMVQLSPDTRIDGSWDGCSGYHYSDSIIYGFSHTHLSGTGVSDYGDVAFMPSFVNKPVEMIQEHMQFSAGFDHANEVATAGYYKVKLDNGLIVELTSTARVGMQTYTAPDNGYIWVQIDLKHRDQLIKGELKWEGKKKFGGFRRSKAWAADQTVFFGGEISKDWSDMKTFADSTGNYKTFVGYWMKKWEVLTIKTGLSSVSEDGARLNLAKELPHWSFAEVKKESEMAWESKMNKMQIFTKDRDIKVNFYTALYHCCIHPSVLNDVDGQYRGRDGKVHKVDWDGNYYTVFSLWDTYRALHPLLNILEPKASKDFMHTFLAQAEQSGRLPMWELWSNETNCMIGMHSIPVIYNTYLHGNIDKDMLRKLYDACVIEIDKRADFGKFMEKGYLEVQDESESVSKTVELSLDFHYILLMEKALFGEEYARNSRFQGFDKGYLNLVNIETGFVQPRDNGQWLPNFDPYEVNNHFTEANSWQYSIPQYSIYDGYHDFGDYTKAQRKLFTDIFTAKPNTTGRTQSDITGLIGQYAHGNEPSHHYFYHYSLGSEQKELLEKVKTDFYKPQPDGIIGNEDCGQMSAWYVFSTLGFYPHPDKLEYMYGSMNIDSAIIQTKNGEGIIYPNYYKTARTQAYDDKLKAGYKYPIRKNNKKYPLEINRYETTMYDKDLTGVMVHRKWNYIYELSNGDDEDMLRMMPYPDKSYAIAPLLAVNGNTVTVNAREKRNLKTYYFTSYQLISKSQFVHDSFTEYTTPVNMLPGQHIYVYEKVNQPEHGKQPPDRVVFYSHYTHPPEAQPWNVSYGCVLNKQYTANGNKSLVDNVLGDVDWRKGNWQGTQGQDFEVTIDLLAKTKINRVAVHALQDTRSWIVYPTEVQVWGSKDGKKFKPMGTVVNTIGANTDSSSTQWFRLSNKKAKSCQYLKIVAKNYGQLPAWHAGKGEDAFIFLDEIEVK
jgi:predicted alpha-1,2-mannosidase